MRDIELIKTGIEPLYGIKENGFKVVPCIYSDPNNAIYEWEYMQKRNTDAEPHKRFLNFVASLEEIEESVNKLKSEI